MICCDVEIMHMERRRQSQCQRPFSVLMRCISATLATTLMAFAFARVASAECDRSICSGSGTACQISNHHVIDRACVLDWTGKSVTILANADLTAEKDNYFTIVADNLTHNGLLKVPTGDIYLEITHAATVNGDIETRGISESEFTLPADANNTDGGVVSISAGTSITVSGDIDARGRLVVMGAGANATRYGGAGGSISLDADGDISISGRLRAEGREDDGGEIEVVGANVGIAGDIFTSSNLGSGGDITLGGGEVSVSGDLRTEGTEGGGGKVVIDAGNVAIGGSITTDSICTPLNGDPGDDNVCDTSGDGGDVDLDAVGAISVSGRISATSRQATGGTVTMTSGADVNLPGSVDVNSSGVESTGGSIAITAGGDVSIGGVLTADGTHTPIGANDPADPGDVDVEAMGSHRITLESGGRIEAWGFEEDGSITLGPACDLVIDGSIDALFSDIEPDGAVTLIYRQTLTGGGSIEAGQPMTDPPRGTVIECRDDGSGSCVTDPSNVNCNPTTHVCTGAELNLNPPARLTAAILAPCTVAAACGNSVVDPGEECDDGNDVPCDGCSPTCAIQVDGSPCGAAACSVGGTCSCSTPSCATAGICDSGPDCSDGNRCTDDACDAQSVCVHTPHDCDDHDPDTIDTCNVATGCLNLPPLSGSEISAISAAVGLLLDPCANSNAVACAAKAYSCRTLAVADRPRMTISKLHPPDGDERLKLTGRASFGTLQPPLDFIGKGLRLIISDVTGPIFDITVPSGALTAGSGWASSPATNPTKWKYVDRALTPASSITKAAIKVGTGGIVTFSLLGVGNYGVSQPNLPLTAILVLDPTTETTDQCSGFSFPGPVYGCRLNGSGATLKCQ